MQIEGLKPWNLSLILYTRYLTSLPQRLKTFSLLSLPFQSVSYNFNWRVITRKAKRLKKKVFRDSCIQITLLVRQGSNGLRAVDSDMLSRWPLNVIKWICDRISGLVRKIRMTNGPRYSARNAIRPFHFFLPFSDLCSELVSANKPRREFRAAAIHPFFFLSVNLTWRCSIPRYLHTSKHISKFLYSPTLSNILYSQHSSKIINYSFLHHIWKKEKGERERFVR